MALRCFVDELSDPSALKPILPQLMDSIFKLMSEVSTARHTMTPACRVIAVQHHNRLHMKVSAPRQAPHPREVCELAALLILGCDIRTSAFAGQIGGEHASPLELL
jgi:hypothetical protein